MTTILERIQNWLGLRRRTVLRLSPEAALVLARELEATEDDEFDCEQVYKLLEQFTEAELRGEDQSSWTPMIRAHLERCADCRQEFVALLAVLQASLS